MMLRYFRNPRTVPAVPPPSGLPGDTFDSSQLLAIAEYNSRWWRKIAIRIAEYSFTDALVYALARFYSIRRIVIAWRRMTRNTSPYETCCGAGLIDAPPTDEVLGHVRSSSWCPGFTLGSDSVQRLMEFAAEGEFTSRALPAHVRFRLRDRSATEHRYQRPIALADAATPMDSTVIQALVRDRTLHDIARRYLGYPVKLVVPRILVSFATDASPSARLAQKQTIFYHYDLDDFHMLIFNFYLTHVDESTGAHVLLAGTHGRKKFRQLFSSLNFADHDIAARYREHQPVTICGEAGTGFVEDPFCFHKAPPPRTADRYMLQLRFM